MIPGELQVAPAVLIYDPASGPAPVTVPMGAGHPAVALHVLAQEDVLVLEAHVAWQGVEDHHDLAALLRELASVVETADSLERTTITQDENTEEGE